MAVSVETKIRYERITNKNKKGRGYPQPFFSLF
jgi:hypothetical protein